jgi:drug/metabolite transporter (DMT)-like permease
MLFLQIALFHWGLTRTNSAHGSVLIGSNPVFVALIAHFALQGDRLNRIKAIGLVVAVIGIMAVVAGTNRDGSLAGDPATLLGDAVILVSSFLLGAKTTFTKHALATTEVAKLLLWSNLIGTVLFLTYSLAVEGVDQYRFTPAALWGLAYQGFVVAGFCFLTWTALLRRHRASQLAVFGFAQPLAGMVFGVALRGDHWSLWLVVGGLAVACGIYLVNRAEQGN